MRNGMKGTGAMIQRAVGRITAWVIMVLLMTSAIYPSGLAKNNAGYVYSSVLGISNLTGEVENLFEPYLAPIGEHAFLTADDVVDVIVVLEGESLIDTYNRAGKSLDADGVSAYARSSAGKFQASNLLTKQNKLIDEFSKDFGLELKYNYTTLTNGFSGLLRYGDINSLRQNKNVKDVIISEAYSMPTTVEDIDIIENPVNADPYTGIYESAGLSFKDGSPIDGEGMLVAILDTGYDYNHEVFKTIPSNPVLTRSGVNAVIQNTAASYLNYIGGGFRDLAVDDVYISDKIPFAFNYANYIPNVQTSESHGTHVAGIVAGNPLEGVDTIRGAAPNAQLALLQVFGSDGSAAMTSTILYALTDAVLLDADVINMSLGMAMGFSVDENETVNEIYNSVSEAGISLVIAAGNDFSSGYDPSKNGNNLTSNPDSGAVGMPATFTSSLAVGSISGIKSPYLLANDSTPVYVNDAVDRFFEKRDFVGELLKGETEKTFNYVKVPGIGSDLDYMGLQSEFLNGNTIALVKRGQITFEEKASYAQHYGAVACIIYNNVSGIIGMQIDNSKGVVIPVSSTSIDTGEALADKGTIKVSQGLKSGPFISDYSSWGVLPDLTLKPEITAHGGEVYSAVPGNDYSRLSGTSMAAPNASGAMALLRQYLRTEFPDLKKSETYDMANRIIMSTATIAKNQDGNPYSPRKQGAGLADIFKAVKTEAYLFVEGQSMTKLSAGDDKEKSGVFELAFSIQNLSNTAKSFRVAPLTMTERISSDGKTVAEASYMLSPSMSISVSGNVSLNAVDSISVRGLSSGEITVRLSLSDAEKNYIDSSFENGMFVEGFVRLLSIDKTAEGAPSDIDLSIPWTGFYGDWTRSPLLDVTAYDIARSNADSSVQDKDKLKEAAFASIPTAYFYVGTSAYEFGMGDFSYTLNNEANKPAISEDKAALSESEDGHFALAGVSAGLLRSAKTMDVSLSNALTGVTVYEETLRHLSKSYYSSQRIPGYVALDLTVGAGEFSKPVPETMLGLANNTKYNLNMTGYLDYPGEQNNLKNSYSFGIYIDSDSPYLIQERTVLRIEERNNKKHYYLDMYVFDNHYIEAMMFGTYSKIENGQLNDIKFLHEDNVIPMNTERNSITYVTRDLTEHWDLISKNGEKLFIQFTDYAKNASTYVVNIPRIEADEFSFVQDELTVKVNETVDLKNYLASTPDDAWKFGLDWSAKNNNENILIAGGDGEIMGLNATGSEPVVVTVKNTQGDKASIKIRVQADGSLSQPSVNELKMTYSFSNREDTSISQLAYRGDKGELTLSSLPWNSALPEEIVWSSSDTDFITVTRTGNAPYLTASFEVINALPTSNVPVTLRALVKGTSIFASVTFTVQGEYEIENSVLKTYRGFGDQNGVVNIPDSLGIKTIGYASFAQNEFVKKVVLPDGVTEISALAFALCPNLETLVLPDTGTLKYIGYMAFNECYKLTTIENFGSVQTVLDEAFATCDLQDLDTKGLQYIGPQAFVENTNLTSVDISNVRYMGANAFTYCDNLTNIKTSEITVIGEGAFAVTGVISLILKARYIGPGAFADCENLRSVVIASDLLYVGNSAFSRCVNLESVIFSGVVPIIEGYAFRDCVSLVSVILPEGLETLGESAFGDCPNLESVTFPRTARLRNVGYAPFGKIDTNGSISKVTEFIVEDGNPYLSVGSNPSNNDVGYLYNATKTILILATPDDRSSSGEMSYGAPTGLREIGQYAFSGHEFITSVSIPWIVNDPQPVKIADGAFMGSSIVSLTGANAINYIGFASFAASSLQSFQKTSVGIKLDYIDVNAFYGCSSLEMFSADLSALTYLGAQAFYNCTALAYFGKDVSDKDISYKDVLDLSSAVLLEEISDTAFMSTSFSSIKLPEGLKRIGVNAFSNMPYLIDIEFPFSLVTIDKGAFMGCAILTSITLSESVRNINQSAFNACRELVDLNTIYEDGTILKGLTEVRFLGQQAFYLCPLTTFIANKVTETEGWLFALPSSVSNIGLNLTLTSVDMPRLQTVGAGTFAGCRNLLSVNIPNARTIGESAFEECISLTVLSIPLVREIEFYAFYNCVSLAYVDSQSVEIIAPYAFANTASLSYLRLDSVQYIASAAFMYSSLSKIYLPETLEYLDESAFVLMPYLVAIEVSPLNKLYFSNDGVLYSVLPVGGYQLELYPMMKLDATYEILEGTIRIAENAFLGNSFLTKVTFPWSIKSIGDAAFFGCQNLLTYKFKSYEPPTLESHFIAYYYLMSYMNFGEFIGDGMVVMERPVNGVGYDYLVYELYFSSVIDGALTPDYVTMAVINAIALIPDEITLSDKGLIEQARSAYEGIQTDEQRSLVTNYDKLLQAEDALNKLENPSTFGATQVMIIIISSLILILLAVSCAYSIKRNNQIGGQHNEN